MTHPHFSISTLMAVVLVLAINLAAGGGFFGMSGMEWPELLDLGARPMASILAIGLVPLLKARSGRSGKRPFLVGFEIFGVAALFLYIACAWLFTHPIHDSVGNLLERFVSSGRPLFPWSLMAIFLLPQLLIALLGGWLSTRYRVTVRIGRAQTEGPE
jgi:hypothetical protein